MLALTEPPEKFVAQYDCKNHQLISLEKQVDEVKPVQPVVPPLNIASVQQCLKMAGHDPGMIDGVSGLRTRTALLNFQKSAGLPATGVADDETRMALKPCLVRPSLPLSGR
ncbi:peptidoglycan-binding domain-containing protein [Aquabacterium sp.]|uniref:peptidoglycan-binding domain-containing protein n=1 Tax=Aquabacterium sp. TaxID=1872578 RepID=UPI0024897DF9|nr:peptidoglycan-binding domain-containing protein [Aquabacterium sp.]MDI1258692.1 peptidoglycan-binding domain-containing protein [Aquabacterium sp.]